jgi:hypothetical protein
MMSEQRSTLVILSQWHKRNRLFQLVLFSLIVILVGGGVALLLQTQPSSHASGGSVVSPPTLPAPTVDAIFARLGSPMVGTGKVVVQASQKAKVDDAFALAVWWVETNDGAAGVGRADRNPGSVRGSVGYPSAFDGYTIYPSYSDAIVYWFGMIRHHYVDRGLSTVYAISHPYVGTSSSPLWAAKVTKLMLRYRSEAPAPRVVKANPTESPYVVSMLRKYRRLPGGYTGTATSYDREQAEITSSSATSQPLIWSELGLTFFALLAACIIAIGAIRLRHVRPVPISRRDTTPLLSLARFTPGINAISSSDSGPLPVQTEPLVKVGIALSGASYHQGYPDNTQGAYEGNGDTEVPLRRVVLVPSQLTQPVSSRSLESVGTRPTGLLSRYKIEQMSLSRFEQDQ